MVVQDCHRVAKRWPPVDAAPHPSTILSMQRLAKHLGYTFSGTTDLAIVLKQAARIDDQANGLCIGFPSKYANREDHYN